MVALLLLAIASAALLGDAHAASCANLSAYSFGAYSGNGTRTLVPAARGTGIVASPTSKKVLQMAGVQDCYTASQGHTKTRGNFAKAAFDALSKSYGFLTPDLWRETKFLKAPYQEHTDYLQKTHHVKRVTSSLLAPRE